MRNLFLTLSFIAISIYSIQAQNISDKAFAIESNVSDLVHVNLVEQFDDTDFTLNTDKGPTIGYLCNKTLRSSNNNNSNVGVAFTIEAKENIIVTGFNVAFENYTGYAHIYKSLNGLTAVNYMIPSNYQLTDSVLVTKTNSGAEFRNLRLTYPVHLLANEKITFYIAARGNLGIAYKTGTSLNSVAEENNELKLLEGIGLGNLFSNVFYPRTFVGDIQYCTPEELLCDSVKSIGAFGNSGFGLTFDIVAKANPVEIDNFITYISSYASDSIRVFTTQGSGTHKLANKADWTEQAGFFLNVSSENLPNAIKPTSKLTINPGDTMGVYLAINEPGQQTGLFSKFFYKTSPAFGSLINEDQNIQILSGTAATDLFISNEAPRQFIGSVSYCVKEYTSIEEVEEATLQIYPNPSSDYISISGLAIDLPYNVYDIQGKIVKNGIYNTNSNIDIQNLKTGIYVLELKGSNLNKRIKFIKK